MAVVFFDITEKKDEMLVAAAKGKEDRRLLRELGLKSFIGVPLKLKRETLGVLSFLSAQTGRHYGEHDLSIANDLASHASIAIENSQFYARLKDANRRKDEFLATLAPALRNPLAPIRNALQILKMPRLDAVTLERSREMMERHVQQLVRLVDDLLDVSRVMRGKIELRKERVELATVVVSPPARSRAIIGGRFWRTRLHHWPHTCGKCGESLLGFFGFLRVWAPGVPGGGFWPLRRPSAFIELTFGKQSVHHDTPG